ncbi:uncharacterized protein METZ01_LOCUS481569, partial [marine metagenome]
AGAFDKNTGRKFSQVYRKHQFRKNNTNPYRGGM